MTTSTLNASKIIKTIGDLLEISHSDEGLISEFRSTERVLSFRNEALATFVTRNEKRKAKGITAATLEVLSELVTTKKPKLLLKLEQSISPGIVELLKIKGLGAKKIILLTETLKIQNVQELLSAIEDKSILKLKGFAEKNTLKVKENLELYLASKGFFKIDQHEETLELVTSYLHEKLPKVEFQSYGNSLTKAETFKFVEIISLINNLKTIATTLQGIDFKIVDEKENLLTLERDSISLKIHGVKEKEYQLEIFKSSFTNEHFETLKSNTNFNQALTNFKDDKTFFTELNLDFQEPATRNHFIKKRTNTPLITQSDIIGVTHTHTNYSDGLNTISEMVLKSQELGYKYLLISDHSQSAGYANGLSPAKLEQQAAEIDKVQADFPDFKILKGVEADILKNGALDYSFDILETLEIVISSVHSNFELEEVEMTERIIKALDSGYANILAHPTGRLLLKRSGYQVNIEKVLEAAKKNNVIIELNSNPHRLDLSWTFLPQAKELGLKFAISPDAHSIEQIKFIEYGILMARKAGLTKDDIINCYSAKELQELISTKEQ